MRPACAPRWGFYIRRALTKNVKLMRPGRAWVQKTPGARAARPPCPHPPLTPQWSPPTFNRARHMAPRLPGRVPVRRPTLGVLHSSCAPRWDFHIRRAPRVGDFTFVVRPALGVLHSSCAPRWEFYIRRAPRPGDATPPPHDAPRIVFAIIARRRSARWQGLLILWGQSTVLCPSMHSWAYWVS
jgi:hypothetical protein